MVNQCALSELDIFASPPVQSSIVKSRWVEYTPTVNYDKGKSAIIINIVGTPGEYIDLSNLFTYARLTITSADSTTKIKDTDEIGPINYLLNTLFKQVDVRLNNTLVSSASPYAYRAIIEAQLNHGTDTKLTTLRSGLWVDDTPGQLDTLNFKAVKEETSASATSTAAAAAVNNGLIARRSHFLEKTVEVYGRPHIDIVNVNKFLPDNISVELKFNKNSDEFLLLGNKAGYRVNIDEFLVSVRKVELSTETLLAQAMALEKKSAYLEINRVEVKTMSIAAANSSVTLENIITGFLPQRIILGMVEQEAFEGNIAKNPFNFQHFDLSELNVTIDGNNTPYQPFVFDFDKDKPRYIRGYQTLIGLDDNSPIINNITPEQYTKGLTLVALNLSQDGCINNDHINPERRGNLRIKFSFSKALPKAITVILYCEHQSSIGVSKDRQIDNSQLIS